jgi:hypothetical protein
MAELHSEESSRRESLQLIAVTVSRRVELNSER